MTVHGTTVVLPPELRQQPRGLPGSFRDDEAVFRALPLATLPRTTTAVCTMSNAYSLRKAGVLRNNEALQPTPAKNAGAAERPSRKARPGEVRMRYRAR